jgi:hypothetical protein
LIAPHDTASNGAESSGLVKYGAALNSSIGLCFISAAFWAAFLRPRGASNSCRAFSLMRARMMGLVPISATRIVSVITG